MYFRLLFPLLFLSACTGKEVPQAALPQGVPTRPVQPIVMPVLHEAKHADLPVPVGFSPQPSAGPFRYAGSLSIEQVRDFYHKQMERLGWVLEDYSIGDEGLLVCRKPARTCVISIRTLGTGTHIVLFTEQVNAETISELDINEKPLPGALE